MFRMIFVYLEYYSFTVPLIGILPISLSGFIVMHSSIDILFLITKIFSINHLYFSQIIYNGTEMTYIYDNKYNMDINIYTIYTTATWV